LSYYLLLITYYRLIILKQFAAIGLLFELGKAACKNSAPFFEYDYFIAAAAKFGFIGGRK
jgi:hypothetical protein